MSKELTPLEAWERANNNAYEHGYEISGDLCYIIETALKRLEKIDNEPIIPLHINRYYELSKKEDVLETLKAFGFEIEDYTENDHGSIKVKYNRIIVDDEEIDIAKEVLL